MANPDPAAPSPPVFFTKQYYENQWPLCWTWPLHVTLFRDDPQYGDQLMQGHWTKQFVIPHTQSDQPWKGILLHPEGLQSLNDLIQTIFPIQHLDVALLFEKNDFFKDPNPDPSIQEKTNHIVKEMGLSGLFIIPAPDDPVGWFNYFLENLSHNFNVIEALQNSTRCGYFFYDQKLETETRLSSVYEGIKIALRKKSLSAADKKIEIQSRVNGYQQLDVDQLSDFIEQNERHFRFDHESGEASGLIEITSKLYPAFGEEIFSMHVKNAMQLNAPPPPEVMAPSDSQPEAYDQSPEVTEDTARYLQTKITGKDSQDQLNLPFLRPETDYDAYIKIATLDVNFVSGFTPVNATLVFEKSVQQEEELTIRFVTGEHEPVQSKTLTLPRQGNSEEIQFTLSTKGRTDTFTAKIFVYHGQRLIQIGQLQSHIVAEGDSTLVPGTIMTTLFSASTDQESLDAGKKYANSFHVLEDEHGLQLLESPAAKETTLRSSDGLKKLVSKIKTEIETAARNNTNEYPEDLAAKTNVDLLRRLAYKGNDLFVNYLHQQKSDGPVQIVAYQQEYVPLDFVYTLPAPSLTAGLCDHAVEALKEGACKKCHTFNQSPADHICPFGFWGLQRVIERFRYDGEKITNSGDFAFVTGDVKNRPVLPILRHVIHASTVKTEAVTGGLRDAVYHTIENNSAASYWSKSWKDWGTHIQEKEYPESLLLIVHTEINEIADVPQLEIENADFLLKNLLNKDQISISDDIKPFVVVIGCSTADLQDQGFDISSQFLNNGAAIVVSNFTKIRGSQAGKIMIRLIELLKANTHEEATLGEVMLKLRQQMLAEGLIVSLSVITHGDANWKIKS